MKLGVKKSKIQTNCKGLRATEDRYHIMQDRHSQNTLRTTVYTIHSITRLFLQMIILNVAISHESQIVEVKNMIYSVNMSFLENKIIIC